MSSTIKTFKTAKKASVALALLSNKTITRVLYELAKTIKQEANFIIKENKKDLAKFNSQNSPLYDRLKLTKERIYEIADGVRKVANLPSPLNAILEQRVLPNGLKLSKITVPLGVVAVIYEARPNVTVDVFALCFKSGNASILKGGSEARHSNTAFVNLIRRVLLKNNIDANIVNLQSNSRKASSELMTLGREYVDALIPRGGQNLINYVRENSKIPIIETGAGVCHAYFDEFGDTEKGKRIIENAKTRRPSVCNALDTLIIHGGRLKDLPALLLPLSAKNVTIYADKHSYNAISSSYPSAILAHANQKHFGTEFLSLKMAIKTVSSIEEALEHIARYGTKHSEAIISENKKNCERFLRSVDAGAVYANASTAFTDGGQFGMGAEIGISTQKLHARGPMGLRELTSYKWIARGSGQIRNA